MKLGGNGIRTQFQTGKWHAYRASHPMGMPDLEPLIGPNSIDVTLGRFFLKPKITAEHVRLDDPASVAWETIEGDALVIHPGQFYLACVRERFECKAEYQGNFFAPMYEGRSTLGRVGIASHITAGFGDYGFEGAFTLELYNHFPIPVRLDAGMRIGQIAFDAVVSPTLYAGAYSGPEHHSMPIAPTLGKHRV